MTEIAHVPPVTTLKPAENEVDLAIDAYFDEPPHEFEFARGDCGVKRWMKWKAKSSTKGDDGFGNSNAYEMLHVAGNSMCSYDEKVEKFLVGWDNSVEIKLTKKTPLPQFSNSNPKPSTALSTPPPLTNVYSYYFIN